MHMRWEMLLCSSLENTVWLPTAKPNLNFIRAHMVGGGKGRVVSKDYIVSLTV